MADVYPSRPQFFAHKFERLLARCCAAQEVTAAGCWLLSIIAHCEDAKGYRGPVTYWNSQLMPILGLSSWRQFDAVRQKCIDAGWLHYEAGGTRQVGKYWVKIPERLEGLNGSDTSCDVSIMVKSDYNPAIIPRQSDGNQADNPAYNVAYNVAYPSTLSPDTYPKNKKEPAGGDRITDRASLPDSTITVRHEVDPMEVQRRADEALEQSLDLVDDWPLPTAIDDSEGRHWVASWVASRFLSGHGWMNHLQWDGHTSGHRSMSREWWQRALQASAAGGWKNLAKHVGKPVDECKPKQRKPRLLTPEEIEVYNATGQLPDGALDPL